MIKINTTVEGFCPQSLISQLTESRCVSVLMCVCVHLLVTVTHEDGKPVSLNDYTQKNQKKNV